MAAPARGGSGRDAAYVRFVGVEKTYDGETLVVRDFDLDMSAASS